MTGGPNNWGARFQYPADQAPDTYVQYNYKDTVVAQWTSWAKNSSVTNLRIWYWDPTMEGKPNWAPLELSTVAQNGSKAFTLDQVKNSGYGYYLGQWNLNFTRADNAPAAGLTLSNKFNVSFDDSIPPRTFSSGMAALPTSTSPPSKATDASNPPISLVTVTPTSTPSSAVLAAGATAAAASSATASPVASGMSGGAIAGLVIGLLAILALIAAGAFIFYRRQQKKKAAAAAGAAAGGGFPAQQHQPPPQYTQYSGQQHPAYQQGYPQGYNQAYPQQAYNPAGAPPMAGAAAYGGDYKQPLPPPLAAQQNEYYNKQQAHVQHSPVGYHQQQEGHTQYSELPAQTVSTDHRAIRQELPG